MSIIIYRHMKLHVAVPNSALAGSYTKERRLMNVRVHGEPNTAIRGIAVNIVASKDLTVEDGNRQYQVWGWSDETGLEINSWQTEGHMSSEVKTERMPPLVNLTWTDNQTEIEIFEQMETMASRSIIEDYMHRRVWNPLDWCIVSVNCNPARNKALPNYQLFPVRRKEEVEAAKMINTEDTPEQWIKLLMGE